MGIPKFHETLIPILKVIENGETFQAREMYQKVIDQFYPQLTKEQLEQTTTRISKPIRFLRPAFCNSIF